MRKIKLIKYALILILALWLCSGVNNLYAFGLNKVQYHRFDWSYYQTENFDIYFPQGGDSIAYFAANHVEEMAGHISEVLGHKLTARIPIILHNTHAEFEQTNVIRYPLHEAIGGFTEMFKKIDPLIGEKSLSADIKKLKQFISNLNEDELDMFYLHVYMALLKEKRGEELKRRNELDKRMDIIMDAETPPGTIFS